MDFILLCLYSQSVPLWHQLQICCPEAADEDKQLPLSPPPKKASLVRIWFLVIKSLHFKLCPELLRGKNFKTDLVFCSLYSEICRDLTFSSKHVHLSPPCMVTPIIYSAWQARLKFLMFLRPSGFRRYQKMVLALVTRG